MQSTHEIWKPIVGYEGLYEVSDLGRVRSLARTSMRANGVSFKIPAKVLKTPPTEAGYPVVNLYRDGRVRTSYVHHMVAETFIGPRPSGMEICHRNGDSADARLANLRYGTPSSNNMDKVQHGTHARGERYHAPVLTEAIVKDARARKASGRATIYAMAREYGVNYGTLRSAVIRESWAWLD